MEKRILFISTSFNNYYQNICDELKKNKFIVDWYSDRPSESKILKSVIRINPKLAKISIRRYEKKILSETKNNIYSIIFVILGQSFTQFFWEQLRKNNPKSYFVYYTWDSIKNFNCILDNIKYFDKKITFDKIDAANYGMKFIPLFYIDEFHTRNENSTYQYDFCYIGTIKPNRYKLISKIIKKLKEFNLNGFVYFYSQSRLVYLYYKIRYFKEFKNLKFKNINFELLTKKECSKLENMSKMIIDVQQENQNGLTIRTMETLALGKKLITTNKNIKDYDIYDENNIYVVENLEFNGIEEFIHKNYSPIKNNILKKYSLEQWIKNILDVQ